MPLCRPSTAMVLLSVLLLMVSSCHETSNAAETTVSSLYVRILDERVSEVIITLGFPTLPNYSHFCVLLPFAIDTEVMVSPKESICASGKITDKITFLSLLIPSGFSMLEAHVKAKNLIEVYDSDWCRLEMNFNYSNVPKVVDLEKHSKEHAYFLVSLFQEIEIEFPAGIDLRRIDDSPRSSETNSRKKYSYKDISGAGGRLTVRFPSRTHFVVELFEIALFLIPGALAIAAREELKKNPRIPKVASCLFWVLFIVAAYLYISGIVPWKYSIIFLVYAALLTYVGFERVRRLPSLKSK